MSLEPDLQNKLYQRKGLALAIMSTMFNCRTVNTPYNVRFQQLLDDVYKEIETIKKDIADIESATRPS